MAGVSGSPVSTTISVTVNPLPLATLSPSNGTLTCSQASLTLTAGGGSAYTFSAGATPLGSTNQAVVTTAGTYSVTVTGSAGCRATATSSISFNSTFVANAGASSTTALVGRSLSLSATGGNTYQWLAPGGALLSSPATTSVVSATLTSSGPQVFTVVVSQGSCSQSLTVGVSGIQLADLTPVLYARPSLVHGSSPLTVVVDVMELNSVATSGSLTVRLTKDPILTLSFDATLSSLDGRAVQNSVWRFSDADPDYYILTTAQPIAPGSQLSLGLSGRLVAGASTGVLTVSATVLAGTLMEGRLSNNTDADKVEYFQQ